MKKQPLEKTNPEEAKFFLDLYKKAKLAYNQDEYIPVKDEKMLSESYSQMCNHMDIEMVRLGFMYGRMFEQTGVIL